MAPPISHITALRERALDLAVLPPPEPALGPPFLGIVGGSPAMRRVLSVVERIARTSVPVLVQGESGTGKELIARAVHFASPRRAGPFVAVNCAALPEDLLESELFGHARGSFTGAVGSRTGLFHEADGGTLFLDEIGDTSPGLQAKLLRVLQNGEVRPVGSTDVRRVDVRLVSASLARLDELVAQRRFREDLFFRVNAVVVALPALRERREDVPALVEHLLERIGRERGADVPRPTSSAMSFLLDQRWPGNVRQLENVLRAATALTTGPELSRDDVRDAMGLPARPRDRLTGDHSLRDLLDQSQLEHVQRALDESGGNISRAARRLGISRQALYRIADRLALDVRR